MSKCQTSMGSESGMNMLSARGIPAAHATHSIIEPVSSLGTGACSPDSVVKGCLAVSVPTTPAMTDGQTDRRTDRQADRGTQTWRQTDRQTDRQTYRQTDLLYGLDASGGGSQRSHHSRTPQSCALQQPAWSDTHHQCSPLNPCLCSMCDQAICKCTQSADKS